MREKKMGKCRRLQNYEGFTQSRKAAERAREQGRKRACLLERDEPRMMRRARLTVCSTLQDSG
jgi:hypothetical protein